MSNFFPVNMFGFPVSNTIFQHYFSKVCETVYKMNELYYV